MSYISRSIKTVSARVANHQFSELLARVERGEEVLITKRGKPVALLSPYRPALLTPERQSAIDHAIALMGKGLRWGKALRSYKREEMHER
jgi:prevent-host-death family protein